MSASVTAAPSGAKRNANRLQRIFRAPKGNLPMRPFHVTVTEEMIQEARALTKAKPASTSAVAESAEEGAEATAETTPAVTKDQIREAHNRLSSLLKAQSVARRNAGIESAILKKLEQEVIEGGNLEAALKGETPKTAAEIAAAKRAERFGVVDAAPTSKKGAPVDPQVQAALDKRAQRFATSEKPAAAPAIAPVELTPEMQAAFDARARRFAA